MVYFELKKVFSKMSSRIALLLLMAFLIYAVSNGTYVVWLNEDGTEVTGKAAAEKLLEAEQEWCGPLTEEKIADIITQGWSQGSSEIRYLLAMAFGGFDRLDTAVVDTLTAEDAGDFYGNRIIRLKEYFEEMGDWYTEGEKEFIATQYEAMEIPLEYEYTRGWTALLSAIPGFQMFLLLLIGFLVAGIFSEEYRTGAGSVFFSSALGRGKAVAAKVKAGFLIITLVYWLPFAMLSFLILLELGSGGADCMIQISLNGWKSFYNITFFQKYLLMAAGGYVGCLFVDSLAMLVSAKTKSAVVATVIPFAVLFIPSLIRLADSPLAEKINGLMPYQLVQMNSVIHEFYLYQTGGKFVGAAGVLLVLYAVLAAALQPVMYRIFRRGEG